MSVPKVFCSYSRRDQPWMLRLKMHFEASVCLSRRILGMVEIDLWRYTVMPASPLWEEFLGKPAATELALPGRTSMSLAKVFFSYSRTTEGLHQGGQGSKIQKPPGWLLRRFADVVFSPKVFIAVLEPTLKELYEEYCQALSEKRPWKARWVRIRGYWSFWSAVAAQLPISLMKRAYELWKASR